MHKTCILVLIAVATSSAIGAPAYDYSTPEKSLWSLEQALIAKDIDAAVNSKAFLKEAQAMAIPRLKERATKEIIASLARSLELSYRLEIKKNGFPDFGSLKCSATHHFGSLKCSATHQSRGGGLDGALRLPGSWSFDSKA